MLSRRRRSGGAEVSAAPIVVLGSGQRCGSTLVQRLLSSHPDVYIWGEQGGHLAELLPLVEVLRQWDSNVAVHGRAAVERSSDGWMANVLAGPEAIDAAVRGYLVGLFAEPAAARGRSRWGFKEVRLSREHVESIRTVFPELTVVHITRDPRKVLSSLDAWERQDGYWTREYTEIAIAAWRDVNASFLAGRDEPWVLSVRYEDVVADPRAFLDRLAAHVSLPAAEFDVTVFDRRVRGYGPRFAEPRPWEELKPDMRALLDDNALQAVASSYGYAL